MVSQYIRDFSEIENWFEIQDDKLLKLNQDEINKWLREANLYKSELKTQRDHFLHLGEEQLAAMKSNESIYSLNDRSYSKRKNAGKLVLADSYEYPYENNNNPLDQLDYINERLQELIAIYSNKNPPHIFREFMSRKGTKRHQAYAEMEFLMDRAEVLVGLLDKSARSVGRIHEDIDTNAENKISEIKDSYNADAKQLDLEYVERVKAARQQFEQSLQTALPVEDLLDLDNRAEKCSLAEGSYKTVASMPEDICVGSFEFEINVTKEHEYITDVLASLYGSYIQNGTILVLPLLLKAETTHLLFINNKDAEGVAVESVKGFICHYLLNMPVSSVNCFFIDGYHSGANFKIFSPLNNVDSSIVRNEVATSSQSINKLLDIILKSNEALVQKKLNGYDTLFDFNRASGSIYERYSLLVIDNFPKGFNDEALEKLERILIQSEQCGVSIVINYNENLFSDEYGDVTKKIDLLRQRMCCQFHAFLIAQNYTGDFELYDIHSFEYIRSFNGDFFAFNDSETRIIIGHNYTKFREERITDHTILTEWTLDITTVSDKYIYTFEIVNIITEDIIIEMLRDKGFIVENVTYFFVVDLRYLPDSNKLIIYFKLTYSRRSIFTLWNMDTKKCEKLILSDGSYVFSETDKKFYTFIEKEANTSMTLIDLHNLKQIKIKNLKPTYNIEDVKDVQKNLLRKNKTSITVYNIQTKKYITIPFFPNLYVKDAIFTATSASHDFDEFSLKVLEMYGSKLE